MTKHRNITRREFIRKGAAAALAAPLFINSRVFGANDRIVMGCIGMGGQGRGDMGGFMERILKSDKGWLKGQLIFKGM